MSGGAANPKVDFYFSDAGPWREQFVALRSIILGCGLAEDLKWGHPCYALDGRNIVLIHGFKDYCALLFFKGALLKDFHGLLVQQTENVQAGRQIRFTKGQDVAEMAPILKAYIGDAIDVEKAGQKVPLKETREFSVPEELQDRLDADPALKAAFEALTPGRQRAYLLHFSAPKQSKTREARIDKFTPQILSGKGLND